MLSYLWRRLASHNLALVLIGLLTLAVAVGGTLPQTNRLSPEQLTAWFIEWPLLSAFFDTTGLSHVFSAWWFYLLALLLLLNMVAGIAVSIGHRLARYSGTSKPNYELHGDSVPPDVALLLPLAAKNRGASALYLKGVLGLVGIPLFHLGIFLIVVGGVWSAWDGYGAHFELSKGEVYAGQESRLKVDRGTFSPVNFDALLRLDDVYVDVTDGKYLKDLRGIFSVQSSGGEVRQVVVETNKPLTVAGYRIYPKNTLGYSAAFDRILQTGERRRLYIHYQMPFTNWGEPFEQQRSMLVELDGDALFFRTKLVNGDTQRFSLAVTKAGNTIFDGELHPGDVADLKSYKLEFVGVVPWLGFYLASDRPMIMVFCAFVVTLIGYLLHLLIRFRRVEVSVSEKGWSVRAWVTKGDVHFDRRWQQWSKQVAVQ